MCINIEDNRSLPRTEIKTDETFWEFGLEKSWKTVGKFFGTRWVQKTQSPALETTRAVSKSINTCLKTLKNTTKNIIKTSINYSKIVVFSKYIMFYYYLQMTSKPETVFFGLSGSQRIFPCVFKIFQTQILKKSHRFWFLSEVATDIDTHLLDRPFK